MTRNDLSRFAGLSLAAFAFSTTAGAVDNIALGKPYAMTKAPNYAPSRDAGDGVQMTDGIYADTGGFLWTNKLSVCWKHCDPPFGIIVDLGRIEPMSGFSIDFASGASGMPYPNAIMVYTSDDRERWRFVGDLYARSRQENGSPHMDGYETYRARSLKMPSSGRYVQFVIMASTFFCSSELEVYRGENAARSEATVRDPCRHASGGRIVRRILRDVEKVAPGDQGLLALVESLYKDEGLMDVETVLPLNGVQREVWARNAGRLRAAGFSRPAFWTNDRWENLDPLTVPDPSASGDVTLSVEMMRGEMRSTAVNVVNPTDAELPCTFEVTGFPEGAGLDCREVVFTDTKFFEPVSGALRPGEGSRVSFRIPAGVSKQVWISFAKPQLPAGTYTGGIRATFGGKASEIAGEIGLKVSRLTFPSRPHVHVGGWDYSVGDCSHFGAPGNAVANQAMMRSIYVDTFWTPSFIMPKGAKFGPKGELLNADAMDYGLWNEWTARFPDARRYAVFICANGHRDRNGRFGFEGESLGTPRFERMVTEYFRAWRAHIESQGIDPKKVLILIVDEPAEWQPLCKELPPLIVAWAKVLKAAVPEFTLWEDPDYFGDPLQAGREMYDRCDALCPQTLKVAGVNKESVLNRKFFVPIAESGAKEMWLYSCSGPSRTYDPISYYRQAYWLAYQWHAVGCQFWAFGCGGGIGDSWHAYRQTGVEYSPYFVSPKDVMAAKQSEGIKEGVQDYEYLVSLERAIAKGRESGLDVSTAERLLVMAPAKALNQTGKDGREKYVRADSLRWNDPKNRHSVEEARLEVLHELERLMEALRANQAR